MRLRTLSLLLTLTLVAVAWVWRSESPTEERAPAAMGTDSAGSRAVALGMQPGADASARTVEQRPLDTLSLAEARMPEREAASSQEHATLTAAAHEVRFRVDGAVCEALRCALLLPGQDRAQDVSLVEWSAALRATPAALGALATDSTWSTTVRWSGPIDGAALEGCEGRVAALPLLSVRGVVVTAETLEPIAEATVTVAQLSDPGPFNTWLSEGAPPLEATTGTDGRFELKLTVGGATTITGKSALHRSASLERTLAGDTDLGASLALVPRDTLRVTLIGGEREPERYFAAHHLYGTRAYFGEDWTADVPMDPELEHLDIAIGIPNEVEIETEITTYFSGTAADYPDGVTIVLNAAALDVAVVGQAPDEQRLVALAYFRSPEGVESFASRWIRPGEVARIPLSGAGLASVEVSWKAPDNTAQALVQRTIDAAPGRVTPITLELPKVVRRLHLTHSSGQPFSDGHVFFGTNAVSPFAQPGGALANDGTYVIPDIGQTSIWLHGIDLDGELHFGGVPFVADEGAGPRIALDLGQLVQSSLRVKCKPAPQRAAALDVQLLDAETGHSLGWYPFDDDGQVTLRWFEASRLAIAMSAEVTWSPRGPIPLTSGAHELPVTLRGWLALECGEREVTALEHLESGLTLDALLADSTVRREAYDKGVRFWGIPAGTYRVALAGDSGPRAPLEVPPLVWTKVPAAALE